MKAFNLESMHTAQVHQSVRTMCMATQTPETDEIGTFMFEGENLLERVRQDVLRCREKYADEFKNPIPLINKQGKLVAKEDNK